VCAITFYSQQMPPKDINETKTNRQTDRKTEKDTHKTVTPRTNPD